MINAEQLAARASHIGSSDAAVVAGLPGFGGTNLYDLWAEKTGKIRRVDTGNAATEAGNYLERAILDWAEEEKLRVQLTRNQSLVHSNGFMAANLDASLVNPHGDLQNVEAKSTGILSGFADREQWGEPGTDQVPDRVTIQAHHQMIVGSDALGSPMRLTWVPALLVGVGFVMYHVPYNDDLANELQEIESDFWTKHVIRDIPPTDVLPTLDTLKHFTRAEGKRVPLEFKYVKDWLEAKEVEKAAKAAVDEAQRRMLDRLGDAEIGECEEQGQITYLPQTREAYLVPESTFRVCRWKALKTAKSKK